MCMGAERPKFIWTEGRRCVPVVIAGYGAKQERAERKKVLALAQACKVDVILVTELTRWEPLGQVRRAVLNVL
jgi:hypothetical protein